MSSAAPQPPNVAVPVVVALPTNAAAPARKAAPPAKKIPALLTVSPARRVSSNNSHKKKHPPPHPPSASTAGGLSDRRRACFFAALISFYLLFALSFCLQFIVSPARWSRLVSQSSLANPVTPILDRAAPPRPKPCPSCSAQPQQHSTVSKPTHPGAATEFLAEIKAANLPPPVPVEISTALQHGKAGGVNYYHCSGLLSQPETVPMSSTVPEDSAALHNSRDVVILGGGRFFSGGAYSPNGGYIRLPNDSVGELAFLEFCHRARGVLDSITVVNLDTAVAPAVLLGVLEGLEKHNRVSALPVAALVTPGPSAGTVVDWILYGDVRVLTSRVARHWIPISADSVLQAVDEEDEEDTIENMSAALHSSPLHMIENWPVLAIYGSTDPVGRQGAELLQAEVSGTVVAEIEGGPLCFLESPLQFSDTIIDYMEEQLTGKSCQRLHGRLHVVNAQAQIE